MKIRFLIPRGARSSTTRWCLATLAVALIALSSTVGGGAAQQAPQPRVAVVARAVQPGEVIGIDVTCRCGDVVPRVSALGQDVSLAVAASGDDGTVWHGLIGVDLDTAPGVYPLTVRDPSRPSPLHSMDLRVVAKAFPTRRLQVAPTFVNPPAAELERIAREARMLNALFTGVTPRLWEGSFVAPVAARATSNFGLRSVFNGQPRSPHGGVDFSSPTGTPVVAPAAGRVALAEDLFFTGRTVVIDHGSGLFSLLAHLSTTEVTAGARIERGAAVGRVGATGRVTGAHLHWTIRLNGTRVDPMSLLFVTASSESRQSPVPDDASSTRN